MSTAVEKYKTDVLPALANNPRSVIEAIAENLNGGSISEANLTKIKVPSGGGTFFEIETLAGNTPEKELVGAVVYQRSGRAYFSKPFDQAGDEDRYPDCSSEDGIQGIGTPGGTCATCTMAQFGTAPGRNGQPGRGQACSQRQVLYMIRGEQMMPDIVSVPATSLKPATDFLFKLATSGIKYWSALIGISLAKEKNADGIDYGRMSFRFIRPLGEAEATHAKMWNDLMRTIANEAAEGRKRMQQGGRQ